MKALLSTTMAACMLIGCSDARIASQNLSTAAENFELNRRIVFFNGITDTYLLTIEGRCSIEDQHSQLEVTCKIAGDNYLKHHLGLSDNVSYFSEQLVAAKVDPFHYRIIFKPEAIIPNIELKLSPPAATP